MTTRFFVFGSMSEGMVHWSKISNFIDSSQAGFITAKACRLKVGYPALMLGGRQKVSGQIIELKSFDLLIGMLDEFHGFNRFFPEKSLFIRQEIEAYVDGEKLNVWAYFVNPKKKLTGSCVIEDGDWEKSLRENPPLTEVLTGRQKEYLTKLGAATGREIVPINDLSLYRELMNLDLIVDKGRRLALSSFGQEVIRYLG